MPAHLFIAFLFLVVAMAAGMFITDRARRDLAPEQKAKLLDTLHPARMLALIPLSAYGAIAYLKPFLVWVIPGAAICIASIYVLKAVAVKRAQISETYRRASAIEARIGAVGILLFLCAGLWPILVA